MTLTEAIILGIVQGLTEPLPVSSSAHLVIVPALIPGFQQPSVAFDVLLHLGTLEEFLSLKLLFAMINKTGLAPFAYYCWVCRGCHLDFEGDGLERLKTVIMIND